MTITIQATWLTRVSLLAAVAAIALAAVTFANAHGGDTTQIHACVRTIAGPGGNPPKGQLRIVGASESCTPNLETALDWNGSALSGVRLVFGTVSNAGAVLAGTGFSATLNSPGSFTLSFPAGTWFGGGGGTPIPVGVVSSAGLDVACHIGGVALQGDGSATVSVGCADPATAFHFHMFQRIP